MPRPTRERPAWLREAAEEDAQHPAGKQGAATASAAIDDADTDELPVVEPTAANGASGAQSGTLTGALKQQKQNGRVNSGAARVDVSAPFGPTPSAGTRPAPGELWEWVRTNLLTGWRAVAVAAALILLFLVFVVWRPFGGSSGEAHSPSAAAPAAPAASSGPIKDTGASFSALETKDGKATLDGAGLHWEGEVADSDAGTTITLKGPTAVQIRQGFDLPGSSIQSGVYAVAQQNGEVLHVTYHTFQTRKPAASGADADLTEVTQASIFAVKDDSLVYAGYYRDERRSGSDEVVRTYVPPGGKDYRVSFTAPQGTPIPLLVGFEGLSS